jgi:hypothetical protein
MGLTSVYGFTPSHILNNMLFRKEHQMKAFINYLSWKCFQPSKTDKSKHWMPTKRGMYIDIAEPADFPVAFNVKDQRIAIIPPEDESSASMHDIQTQYRHTDGKLYKPFYLKVSGMEIRKKTNNIDLKNYLECCVNNMFANGKEDDSKLFISGTSIVLLEDNNNEIQDYLLSKASEFKYFERTYWCETTEPRYLVYTYGSKKRRYFETCVFIRDSYNPSFPKENYFNANEYKKVLEYYESEVSKGNYPQPICVKIQVVDKSMVRLPSNEGNSFDFTVKEGDNGQMVFNFSVKGA